MKNGKDFIGREYRKTNYPLDGLLVVKRSPGARHPFADGEIVRVKNKDNFSYFVRSEASGEWHWMNEADLRQKGMI
jgi:hypothetical protein